MTSSGAGSDANAGLAEEGKTHPPIANRLALIDFDGTIVPWGPLMGDKVPFPGVKEALDTLRANGYRIGVFTSRLSQTWARSVVGGGPAVAMFLLEQETYVRAHMTRFDLPFDFVTAEKMPAQFYIDDKAIGFRGDWTTAMQDSLVELEEAAVA